MRLLRGGGLMGSTLPVAKNSFFFLLKIKKCLKCSETRIFKPRVSVKNFDKNFNVIFDISIRCKIMLFSNGNKTF